MTRCVVVTGSASGIGRAVATQLAEQGDDVIGVDLDDADVRADLGTVNGRATAVEQIIQRVGDGLDAVVACAGISGQSLAVLSVNYFGVVDLLTGLRPLLSTAAAPRAALISSVSSVHPTDAELIEACLAGDEPAARQCAEAILAARRGQLLYSSSKAALARWSGVPRSPPTGRVRESHSMRLVRVWR